MLCCLLEPIMSHTPNISNTGCENSGLDWIPHKPVLGSSLSTLVVLKSDHWVVHRKLTSAVSFS